MASGENSNALGTNPVSEETRYNPLPVESLSRQVMGYTDLSDSEKESLKSYIKSLNGLVDPKEILRLSSLVRKDEGRVYRRVLQRYQTVAQPLTAATKGVFTPLDSVIDSNGKLYIYLPENLDSFADSGLIQDLFRFASAYPGVELPRVSGELNLPQEERANYFFMGYLTELLSTQRVERISYNRDSTYQIGRHCARTKILLMAIDQKKIPTKYLKIPSRYLGGTEQFKEPEVTRVLRTLIASSILERIEALLHNLASYAVRHNLAKVRNKLGENLFCSSSEFVHSLKRRVTKLVTSGTRRRGISKVETVDPTKPSQLATVAPWERNSISEIFEDPWEKEKNLIKEFEEIPGLDRDYPEYARKLGHILDQQWGAKQQILRLTRHRLEAYPEKRDAPLWQKLNWIRGYLIELGTLERLPGDILPDFNPYSLIGSEKVSEPDGFINTVSGLHKANRLSAIYPSAEELLQRWDTYRTEISVLQTDT
jgi:hypothetical protein